MDDRGLGRLLRDLAEGSGDLIRQEVRLARVEAVQLARALGIGTGIIALGGVLALIGAFAFVAGLVLLVGDQWLRNDYWLAALVVALVSAVIAGVYVALARRIWNG